MTDFIKVLNRDERAVYTLRALYRAYGYSQYKMSKFEEYDLYVKNKEFLVSENVITFTDTDGKLMALKPDVTLSIIKNGKDAPDTVKKVFYNENVYRASKGTRSFKEIMQVGLECQGDIDDYQITEVLSLAVKSLDSITSECVLDLSHMGVISGVLEYAELSQTGAKNVLVALGEKNVQAVETICDCEKVEECKKELVKKLVTVYGKLNSVKADLEGFKVNQKATNGIEQLLSVVGELDRMGLNDKVRIDFSVVNDMGYYNGIVFKGFVSGIPSSILSGGEYDNLMKKLGKNSGAIGFAVYLDSLGDTVEEDYDVDCVVLYDKNCAVNTVSAMVEKFAGEGRTVIALKSIPSKLKYKELVDLTKGVNV